MEANSKQVGGDHYKKYGDLQPWDVVLSWNLGYLEGTALKYIARWRDKGGLDDIRKAVHFLEKLVEVESDKNTQDSPKDKPSNPPNPWPFPFDKLEKNKNEQSKPTRKAKKN